jgi:hypothetical protein
LYFTMRLAIEWCFTNVEFESDCRNVIDDILDINTSPRSYFGNLVKGVQHNRNSFNSCTFRHMKISLPTPCFSFSPPEFSFIPLRKSSVNMNWTFKPLKTHVYTLKKKIGKWKPNF